MATPDLPTASHPSLSTCLDTWTLRRHFGGPRQSKRWRPSTSRDIWILVSSISLLSTSTPSQAGHCQRSARADCWPPNSHSRCLTLIFCLVACGFCTGNFLILSLYCSNRKLSSASLQRKVSLARKTTRLIFGWILCDSKPAQLHAGARVVHWTPAPGDV